MLSGSPEAYTSVVPAIVVVPAVEPVTVLGTVVATALTTLAAFVEADSGVGVVAALELVGRDAEAGDAGLG